MRGLVPTSVTTSRTHQNWFHFGDNIQNPSVCVSRIELGKLMIWGSAQQGSCQGQACSGLKHLSRFAVPISRPLTLKAMF